MIYFSIKNEDMRAQVFPCIMFPCHHVLLYDYWLFFMSKGDKIKDLSVEHDEGARLRLNTQSRIMRPLCSNTKYIIWELQFWPILTQKSKLILSQNWHFLPWLPKQPKKWNLVPAEAIQGILALCEFHYCNFSENSIDIWVMRSLGYSFY